MQPHGMLDGTCKHGAKQFCGKCVQERAEAAEAERDELKAAYAIVYDDRKELQAGFDKVCEYHTAACKRIHELEAERDELARKLEQAQREIDYLRRNMDLARKQVSEWNAETPLGIALDGLGDEVES